MSRTIKFSFKDIPTETGFSLFDKKNKNLHQDKTIPEGSVEFELEIPDSWEDPYLSIAMTKYYVPNYYRKIKEEEIEVEYTGADYYVDLDREVLNEELNHKSVETLIHTVQASQNIDGRQKFYISLLSLQSYLEFLVYGMLVTSGHISKRNFKDLNNHESRTIEAFSKGNTSFFTNQITICPDKVVSDLNIPNNFRDQVKLILDEIRTLRNKIVHSWGYKDIPREKLGEIFTRLDENLVLAGDDNTFYHNASSILVRLYAKTGAFRNQLGIFNEKDIVSKERESRGIR